MVDERAIQAFADAIAREYRPDRIILFGSYACGRPDDDSDVDLLVVMRSPGNPIKMATEISCRIPHSFSLDLIVRDPEEVDRRVALNDWFLKNIMETGKVLYESAYA